MTPGVERLALAIGLARFGLLDGGGAGFGNGLPDARAHTRQKRHAIRRPFGRVGQRHGRAVHVGLQLPPDRALGPAAREADRLHRDVHAVAHDPHLVGHAEGHAFEHRAGQVRSAVLRRQADERAARLRIGIRAALAGEVRQEHQARAPRKDFRRFVHQLVEGNLRCQRIAEPLQRARGAEHAAEHAPRARHRVAHRVDPSLFVIARFVAVREHHARRAERRADDAALHDAVAHRAGRLIPRPADHGHAFTQTQRPGRAPGERAGDFVRLDAAREQGRIQPELAHERGVPRAPLDVQQQRAGSVADLGRQFAGEPQAQPVLGQQDVRGFAEVFRFVLAEPEDFGGLESGEGRVAHGVDELARAAGLLRDLVALRRGALIVPQQRGPQRFARVVGTFAHEHAAVHLPRQADRGDLPAVDAGFLHGLFHRFSARRPPLRRVLLGPAGPGALHGVRRVAGGEHLAAEVADQRLGARGAQVDAEEVGHKEG